MFEVKSYKHLLQVWFNFRRKIIST